MAAANAQEDAEGADEKVSAVKEAEEEMEEDND
jgi:hypothetical protein